MVVLLRIICGLRSARARRSSCSRSSGVNSAPKSSASNTWRISISDSPSVIGLGQRLTHSIASSIDFDLPDPEAGDQLLGLGERPVDHGALGAVEHDARALRARVQPFAGQHDAGLHELLVVLAHRGQQLLVGHHAGLGVLVRLHDHHESHRRISCVGSGPVLSGPIGTTNEARKVRHPRPTFSSGGLSH